jgi:hypothetical protein
MYTSFTAAIFGITLIKSAESYGSAAQLNEIASALSDPSLSLELGSAAHRVLDSTDCTVDWIGTNDETAFETNLILLSDIPNEHSTLAGRSNQIHP